MQAQANHFLVRWPRLVALSAPVFPFAGEEIASKVFLPAYFSQTMHMSLGVLATIFLVFRVWDTLNDPLVGWWSDHWRFGHRRFVPMLLGMPLALAGLLPVLICPQVFSPAGLLCALVVMALGWTLVNVPHGAWALELAPDPVLRTRVFAGRQMVGLLALPLFALGPGLLEHFYGANSRRDALVLAVIIAITLPASLAWLWASGFPTARATGSARTKTGLATLREAFAERDSLILLGLFACLGVHQEVKDGLILFWVRTSLQLADWSWSTLLVQSLVGLVSVPFWVRLQARHGTLPALLTSLIASAIATAGFIIVPAHSVAALLGFIAVQGLFAGSAFTLTRTLLGDLLDRLAARQGASLAGTLYSGYHLAYNFAVALTLPAVLVALGALGFDPRSGHSAATATLDPVAWMMGCAGSLPLLVAAFAVFRRFSERSEVIVQM